jgi:hypothetical protein
MNFYILIFSGKTMLKELHYLIRVVLFSVFLSIPIFVMLNFPYVLTIKANKEIQSDIIVYGNSVNKASSSCDLNQESIPEIGNYLTPMKVSDFSYGGMTITEMMYSVLYGKRNNAKYIVIPLTRFITSTSEIKRDQKTKLNLMYFLNSFKMNNNIDSSQFIGTLQKESLKIQFYKGVDYGDDNNIAREYLYKEKLNQICPEIVGVDSDFVEFLHYQTYMQDYGVLDKSYYENITSFVKWNNERGTQVLFYFPPINFDLMVDFDMAEVVDKIGANKVRVANLLHEAGIKVFDLSDRVPQEYFTDQWCACGHLNYDGRRLVAKELIGELNQRFYINE